MNALFHFPTERGPRRRAIAAVGAAYTWYALPSHEMMGSRAEIIATIRGVDQHDPILGRVFAFNPAEGWARDETEDLAREVANELAGEGRTVEFELRSWLQVTLGCDTADEILGDNGADD